MVLNVGNVAQVIPIPVDCKYCPDIPVVFPILIVPVDPLIIFPINVVAVTTPVNKPSPTTWSFDVGFVVPKPRLPDAGTNTNFVVDIPTLLTPTLEANVGNTGDELMSWLITLNAFTPCKLEPSP